MITLEKQPVDNARTSLWRSRWAAIGAAVAVSLGAGGMFVAQAAPGASESTIVSVAPERILDTRNGNDIGLPGPFVSAASQKLQVTGPIATATGNKIVVPAGATGVLLNVTPVSPTAAGFISIRPGDAAGAATTSSLNFTAGGISPNSVQVSMPTAGANAGKIDITFDAYGVAGPTTDVLIDVVGYTTNIGLQQLVANVATKANAADVYTKAQVDSGFVPQGEIVMSHGTIDVFGLAGGPTIGYFATGVRVTGSGSAVVGIEGPARMGTVNYGLKSIEYCVSEVIAGSPINYISVYKEGLSPDLVVTDNTDRTADGCFVVVVNSAASTSYDVIINKTGAGALRLNGIRSTWAPSSTIEAPLAATDPSSGADAGNG